ncbi:MAG TPA: polymer-forming cytoskeletal protein [Pyrinomonadaceae bacterium]|nr:polymer-forming cytoskeletal protein [Pyrinomonadaceae bacterium]
MAANIAIKNDRGYTPFLTWRSAAALCVLLLANAVFAHAQFSFDPAENTMFIDDAPEMEVVAYGKNVIVRKQAKGVLAIGGDIIVEGRVEGDVAAIGGSVTQREGAFIGGDVFVVGGKYKPEGAAPLRNEGKETVMYAGYEGELREMAQNPSQIFAPSFTLTFLAQRAFAVLFWFIVSFALITVAPGAVSRAIVRFHLSTFKIVSIGFFTLAGATVAGFASLQFLPNYFNAMLLLMMFALLMLSYVFGRVALHVSIGQLLQKKFLSEGKRSEAIAVLLGVVVWTLLLSIPYIWSLAVLAMFSAGIGLVLTARGKTSWQSS